MNLEHQLNADQIAAVTHGDGPQLVLAGAGSGKTRVITFRVAWLVRERGVEPYRIAAVTFTNKAAAEMRERIDRLVGSSKTGRPSEVFVGTFHRFALRLLRRYGDRVGLPRDFAILDSSDQQAVMKRALDEAGLDRTVFRPRSVLSRISSAKNKLVGPAAFQAESSGFFDTRAADAYTIYQRLLRESGAVDFDDMISLAVELLERETELGDRLRRRLRYLLVDEFQDTNYAQLALIHAVSGKGGNLTAVGDEDQGIYRWRGAELENILDFESSFPGATLRKLEQNYRSTQNILDASGELVAHNEMRRGKRLWTERGAGDLIELYRARDEGDEAAWIVRNLGRLHGEFRYRQMAVLVRTNAQTRAIEDELLRRKVPYCLVGGVRFYERAEIKDLVAYLRVIRKPQDNLALRRILNTPPRGIGKATQQTLFREAEEMGQSLWDVLRHDRLGNVSTRGKNSLRAFRRLIQELADDSRHLPLPDLLQRLLDRTDFVAQFRREDADAASRLENIEEFLSAAQEFAEDFGPLPLPARLDQEKTVGWQASQEGNRDSAEATSAEEGPVDRPIDSEIDVDPLTSFLDYVALVSDTDSLKTDLGVSLMTLHSAKGLEFPVVFVAGLEDGLLPHFNSQSPEEHEEERRLLYVGMTRAGRRLFLTTCRRRRIAGRYQDQLESPFLEEIPEALLRAESSLQLFESDRTDGVRSFFAGSQAASRAAPTPMAPSRSRAATRASELPTIRVRSRPDPAEPRPDLRPSTVQLSRGVRVRHPMLGAGQILAVEGEGDQAKLTVLFERAGKRRLIAKYAGLEPL